MTVDVDLLRGLIADALNGAKEVDRLRGLEREVFDVGYKAAASLTPDAMGLIDGMRHDNYPAWRAEKLRAARESDR